MGTYDLCVYTHINIYIYIYMHIHIHIHRVESGPPTHRRTSPSGWTYLWGGCHTPDAGD